MVSTEQREGEQVSGKKPVLVICRTAAGQMYLGVLLNRIWYSPVLAKTAEEGVLLASQTPFSFILFDGDAPKIELQPAITLLRTDPSINNAPLVLFITNDNPEMIQSLLSQGVSAILTKPLDLAIVYGVLGRLSGQSRLTPRVPLKVPVEIAEGTPEKILTGIDISEGGLYLRTLTPLPDGTSLHIKFMLPHDPEAIELDAEVVRTLRLGVQLESEPGMGLRFLSMPPDTRLRIRNFVQFTLMGDLEWKSGI